MFSVEYSMISEVGLLREENQDRILFCYASPNKLHFETQSHTQGLLPQVDFLGALVADGVGGSSNGAEAATYLQKRFQSFWTDLFEKKRTLKDSFVETLVEIHQELLQENQSSGKNSASTIVLLHLTSTFAYFLNVGDSRGYVLRGKEWKQLTKDDLLSGTNQVLSAIGPENKLSPHLLKYPLQAGDCFLLCSDGLDGMIPADHIFQFLLQEEESLKNLSEDLFQQAMAKGGRDNCSFILIRVLELEEEPLQDLPEKKTIERLEKNSEKAKNSENGERLKTTSLTPLTPPLVSLERFENWTNLCRKDFFQIHETLQDLEKQHLRLSQTLERESLEFETHLQSLKRTFQVFETKILYLLGIFGMAQLILFFLFLFLFKILIK
jgi:serine/threonine protein phosphatase PrpC